MVSPLIVFQHTAAVVAPAEALAALLAVLYALGPRRRGGARRC
jgi:hypothetical protein